MKKQTPTWAQVSPKTILSAMEYVTDIENDGFGHNGTLNRKRTAPLHYIAERLSLTEEQASIITGACFFSATKSKGFSIDDICSFLDLHPFQALQLGGTMEQLDEMGYLMINDENRSLYRMTPQALEAIQADRAFDPDSLRAVDNLQFLREANDRIRAGQRNDRDHKIAPAIERLCRINNHLTVVKNLRKFASAQDRWLLLLMMVTLAAQEDDYVNVRDLEMVLPSGEVRRIASGLQRGQHPFAQNGWIIPYGQDSMAQANQWILSAECWRTFLRDEEEVSQIIGEGPDITGNLKPWTELKHKDLFFSGKTQNEVDRLRQLLEDSTYTRIHDELTRRNMPKGFCCLLYGAPGTGKTELVQQLAIETQRDIMQVDISTLRDKYVGETEKMVKSVFDYYRRAVKASKRAPILFFNEADAIFGNRMERTERSVDKMENAMQNIILEEMERLDGILICTTNLTSNLDKAFDRRFLYKIEFQKPDREARCKIWRSMLDTLSEEQAGDLADRYHFSGGQILNISRKQVINSIFTGNNDLDFDRVLTDCNAESISRNNGRKIGF